MATKFIEAMKVDGSQIADSHSFSCGENNGRTTT